MNIIEQIEIGDVCQGQYFINHTDRNGMLCWIENIIVTDDYEKDEGGNVQEPGTYYCCKWADGVYSSALAGNLKICEVF